MTTGSARVQFVRGIKAHLPLTSGVVPFGLITGVMAIELGLSPAATLGMTLLYYSGSAQMVALQLLAQGTGALVIVMTSLVINLRFIMYSASIAPYLHHLPRRWTWPLAYILSDQAYAVCITRFASEQPEPYRHYYYAGGALILWLAWNVAVMAGVYLGTAIPETWSLSFTIPLSFLALLIPCIRNAATLAAALVGGVLAVAASALPYNLGLMLAAVGGVSTGLLVETLKVRRARPVTTGKEEGSCHE